MVASNRPEAEVDTSAGVIRSLLKQQHPDLAELPLVEFANGWDNAILRLGDDLSVRLPRRKKAAILVEREQKVLPAFARRLPIAIPAPIRVGRPGCGYPWSWSINPWLPGRVAADSTLADPTREARRLGEFLAALHVEAPSDAPPNPYRGHFVGLNTEALLERVARLGCSLGRDVCERILARWHKLVAGVERWDSPPVWLHGDLHAANVLVDNGEISAVIDFGDVCAGDPATDLAVAWMLFDSANRAVFRDAVGVDNATWKRGEAWALHFAVIYLAQAADDPLITRIGRDLLAVLI